MIEFHADDYALFPAQSRRILKCRLDGVLNGTSVMPNSPYLAECMQLLRPAAEGLRLTVHLNLMEGQCLSPAARVPLLVDGQGVFSVSFPRLLLISIFGPRREYINQIKCELREQIRIVRPYLEELGCPLRLDGHAHWHMLPVVFDALMELIEEEQLPVRYIRMPSEPIGLYLRHLPHIFPFHPINLIKTALLRILCRRNRRKYRARLEAMDQAVFLGVLFSGNFRLEKFRLLLPDASRLALRRGWDVELLAHPGAVYEPEDIRRLTNRDDVAFLTSPSRTVEGEAFIRMREDVRDE